jgi:hypothetical protein
MDDTAAPHADTPPDFRRVPSSRRSHQPTGFSALREQLTEAARCTQRRLQLAIPAAATTFDRWERRRSVASRGDRLTVMRTVPARYARQRGVMPLVDDEVVSARPAVSAFESYEYEGHRSQLRFEAEAGEGASRVDYDKLAELLLRGVVPLVLGVSVGALGVISHSISAALIELKWSMVFALVNWHNGGVAGVAGVAAAFPVFAAFCIGLSVAAAALTVHVAPAAAGSGIPMVKAELNGVRVPGALTARTLAVKVLGVTLVVASGLPCGREGPMVQLGAGVACIVLRAHNRILALAAKGAARTQGRVLDEVQP